MQNHLPIAPIPRAYLLDILRGVAALSVVFWHWQHFFYIGPNPSSFDPTAQPFFSSFSLLYGHGGLAVQLFFSISGFVFFWFYAKRVKTGEIGVKRFFQDRFSRLYPLHLVTFAAVALLQATYLESNESYFVYQANNAYHALLNIFLVPAWGFESGWSFNAPIWSVSIEVLMYASFFLICQTGRAFLPLAACGAIIGWFLYPDSYKLGSGLLCFYLGGISYVLYESCRTRLSINTSLLANITLCLIVWLILAASSNANDYIAICLCFPLTLSTLFAINQKWPHLGRQVAFVGDISYSSYLLHFPLQIVFALFLDYLGFPRTIFYHPLAIIIFFVVLLPISLASYHFLERPAQTFLRTSSFFKR